MSEAERISLLNSSMSSQLGTAVVVTPWRSGVDFFVDRVAGLERDLVVRSPRVERLATSYDGVIDNGEVLAREQEALRLAREHGVKAPKTFEFFRSPDGIEASWLIEEYVDHDDGEPNETIMVQLGCQTRRLHGIVPAGDLMHRNNSWGTFVGSRLRERLVAAEPYVNFGTVAIDMLIERSLPLFEARESDSLSLLHMDLRLTNICIKDGHLVALIDFANCIVGDPLFELARTRNYGLLTDQFLAGYGMDAATLNQNRLLLDLYEMDTAALLTVVGIEEIDAPDLHATQRARLTDLMGSVTDVRGASGVARD